MTGQTAISRGKFVKAAADPFTEAVEKLFPPLQDRTLAAAADALADNQDALAKLQVTKFLQRRPLDPDALNLMASIAGRSKQFELAEQFLSQCVEQSTNHPGYKYNYAVVLHIRHKNELALSKLDELLGMDSLNPSYRDQKASVLTRLGRYAEALAYRRQLTEDYSQSPEAWLRYGHALRDAGYQEQCIVALHKALEMSPSLSAAWVSLADLKVYRFTPAEIESLEAQLANPTLSVDARSDLHHALGSAYEREKAYSKSFGNFAKGNALRHLSLHFDRERWITHRADCESLLTEAFFRERTGWGCDSADPIFIVGMPRSGSTLLEQILASHSAIEGLGELNDLEIILIRPLTGTREKVGRTNWSTGGTWDKGKLMRGYLQAFARLDSDHFRLEGEEYLNYAGHRRTEARSFFTDKTLSNYCYVGLIHLILPNARIIDVRRHPLDCGWSCFRSRFGGVNQPFSYNLAEIGCYYANYVTLMRHFDRVLPGKVHRVFYENLVANPRTTIMQLFNYLKLPFEEKCLLFHENKRSVATLSSEQVRTPLYKSGVAQWLPYEPWLGALKAALGPVLDSYPHVPN